MRGFRVYAIDTATGPVQPSGRRDLYTIYLLTSLRHVSRADQEIVQADTRLCLGTPQGASAPETAVPRQAGYCCLFTEAFVSECEAAPAPKAGSGTLLAGKGTWSCSLPKRQAAYLTHLFERMLLEQQATYTFKYELVRSYLQLALHEAQRLQQPAPKQGFRYYYRPPGATGILASGWRSRHRSQA